ncbi:MAG: ATP-dependent helicase [Magnetococcales bacterium]|nr:ATP-dependent helicase [Magnetococcales bacterium]
METPSISEKRRLPDDVETRIIHFFDQDIPPSFFLFAGAGSGKTGTLVEVLKALRNKKGDQLRCYGKRIGVITYTNAACDEIKHRLGYDPLIAVSTIHSFVWSLIQDFHRDIKVWLHEELGRKIDELHEKQRRGRSGKESAKREKDIEFSMMRRDGLKGIRAFTYSPTGDNKDRDALNHNEVINIGSFFIREKPLMQEILVSRFPVLLIDESQDTNKMLMESLLMVQNNHAERFCLGLLGDMMQRIYLDGKVDLKTSLSPNWEQPEKKMNYRSPPRIVELINKIRANVDRLEQQAKDGWDEKGHIRMFILPSNTPDKDEKEKQIAQQMAEITGDALWSGPTPNVKKLVLEHHMAARRMGFIEMFMSLYQVDSLKTGVLDGDHLLPGLVLFSKMVWPLIQAKQCGNEFSVMAIVRNHSPLLSKSAFLMAGADQSVQIQKTRAAVDELMTLFNNNDSLRFLDVLLCVSRTGLFEIPEILRPMTASTLEEQQQVTNLPDDPSPDTSLADVEMEAWDQFLLTPFRQIEPYLAYVSGKAEFDTHQGVKGGVSKNGLHGPNLLPRIWASSADTSLPPIQYFGTLTGFSA